MFTNLMIIMTHTIPIYFDIKESYNEVKDILPHVGIIIDDINEIMPDLIQKN